MPPRPPPPRRRAASPADTPASDGAMVGAATAAVGVLFGLLAPEPYMDEPFHIAQTQAYCRGEWGVWDPKITTPPGLYGAGLAIAWVSRLVDAVARARPSLRPLSLFCSVRHLRLANAAAAGCVFAFAAAAGRRLHPRAQYGGVAAAAALLALLPTHALYTWLYYTDAPGLACLLGCYAASLAGRPVWTALAATAAILCRQTNAVWVAFVAGDALLRAAAAAAPAGARWTEKKGAAAQAAGVLSTLAAARGRPLAAAFPCALPCAAFAAAVVVNGGVALGDKGNHAVAAHWAQAPLAALAAAAALAPAHATTIHLAALRASIATHAGFRRAVLFATLAAAAASTAIAHPFLLSDNRHYTFYAWRALQRVPEAVRPAAVGAPAAAAAAWLSVALAAAGAPALWTAGLAAATCAAVVPSPLIEPRYFTPAIAFAAVRLGPPRRPRLGLALHAAATAAIVYIFLARPFVQEGEVKRFMW